MSANVESLVYVSNEENGRFVPWHGLGTPVEEAPTSTEALRLAGLDWKVESKDLYTDGTLVEGYKANVRSTDGKVLGVTGSRYQITQNSEAFDFTDSLIDGEVRYETAGSLNGGKRIFLLARLPQNEILGDVVIPYVCFTNSFDGSHPIQVCLTPTRVVCNNTLNLALANTPRKWSTRHTGDLKSKLSQAKKTLNIAQKYMEELSETAEKLADVKVSEDEVMNVLNDVFPYNEDDSDRKKRNAEDQKNSFITCLFAPDLAKFKGTGWQVVQAASDYFTHREPMRKTEGANEKRFEQVLDGNVAFDKVWFEMLNKVKNSKTTISMGV